MRNVGFQQKIPAILFIGYSILITAASLMPPPEIPRGGIQIPHLDKIIHFGIYALYLPVTYIFIASKVSETKRLLISLIYCSSYGAFMEILQLHSHNTRSFSIADMIANFAGALAFTTLIRHNSSLKTVLKRFNGKQY